MLDLTCALFAVIGGEELTVLDILQWNATGQAGSMVMFGVGTNRGGQGHLLRVWDLSEQRPVAFGSVADKSTKILCSRVKPNSRAPAVGNERGTYTSVCRGYMQQNNQLVIYLWRQANT